MKSWKRTEVIVSARKIFRAPLFSLLFKFCFYFCVCICVGVCNRCLCTQRPEECIGSFLQTMVLKVQCLWPWVCGLGEGFAIHLRLIRGRPCHAMGRGTDALDMAVLMSIISRTPWLPTNNKNSRTGNSSSNIIHRIVSVVIVAAAPSRPQLQ